jgi:hypothetical protein
VKRFPKLLPPFLIDVRRGKREGIAEQFQARRCSLRDDYFHDIEPEKNVGIAEQTQPGEAAARNSLSLVAIHRIERPAKLLPGSGFDLHENQGVAIATNQVDLSTGSAAEITRQDFVAVPAEESVGQLLPQNAKPKMLGRRTRKPAAPPVRKIVDESDKARVHAV